MNSLEAIRYDIFETRLGWVGAAASEIGLKRLTLPESARERAEDAIFPVQTRAAHTPVAFSSLQSRLERYFRGEELDLTDEVLDLQDAPPFFDAAWRACRRIPAGETRTYAWLAAEAGRPEALRAAGQAMARNKLAIVVPCHRVVRSDGSLGGFGGSVGLPLKQRLLSLEGRAARGA